MSDRKAFDDIAPMEDADKYLERIGFDGKTDVSLECLNRLLAAHQRSVPFENIDVCDLGRNIDLSPAALFDKIVTQHRGGYCFELNGAFLHLLKALGFDVTPCYCRSIRNGVLGGISHRGVLVYLDGAVYFTDVGYGNIMSPKAILMEDGSVTVSGEVSFTVQHYAGSWYEIIGDSPYRINSAGELERIRKTDLVVSAELAVCADFEMFNDRFQGPLSGFRKKRWCIIQTPSGQKSITGSTYFLIEDGVLTKTPIADGAMRRQLMEKEFGLCFTDEQWALIESHTELM